MLLFQAFNLLLLYFLLHELLGDLVLQKRPGALPWDRFPPSEAVEYELEDSLGLRVEVSGVKAVMAQSVGLPVIGRKTIIPVTKSLPM